VPSSLASPEQAGDGTPEKAGDRKRANTKESPKESPTNEEDAEKQSQTWFDICKPDPRGGRPAGSM